MRLNDYTNKLLSLLIIILMLIVNLIFTNKVVVKNTGFGFPIFITIVGFVLVYIGSAYAYSESFTSIFKVSYYYLILLLFFALLNSQKSDSRFIESIVFQINIVGFIYAQLYIIQSTLFSLKGLLFLNITNSLDVNNMQSFSSYISGFQRFQVPGDFIAFAILIAAFDAVMKITKSGFAYVALLVELICLLCVCQTRGYIIACGLFLVIIFPLFHSKVIKTSFIVFAVTGAIIALHSSLFGAQRADSTGVRLQAIPYYAGKIFMNKFFGIGFANDNQFFVLNHGYATSDPVRPGAYYLDDMGLFGFISVWGCTGLISIGFFISSFIKNFVRSRYKIMSSGIIIFLIASNVTMSSFDPQRIMYFPLILFILYFLQNNSEFAD